MEKKRPESRRDGSEKRFEEQFSSVIVRTPDALPAVSPSALVLSVSTPSSIHLWVERFFLSLPMHALMLCFMHLLSFSTSFDDQSVGVPPSFQFISFVFFFREMHHFPL